MTGLTQFDLPAPRRVSGIEASARDGERISWPRAALVVSGVSLLLWAGIIHIAMRFIG